MNTSGVIFTAERCAIVQLQGEREHQQDAYGYVIRDQGNGIDAFVADGHDVGFDDEGRKVAVSAIRVITQDTNDHDLSDEQIKKTFVRIHRLVARHWLFGGATLTWVGIRGTNLVAAWCGDSEARLAKQNGHLSTLTIPHHYGIHRAETRRLDNEGVEIGDSRGNFNRHRRDYLYYGNNYLAISRVIGDSDFVPARHDPEITHRVIGPDDRFLIIASDGLWGLFVKQGWKRHRFEAILREAANAEEAKQRLEALVKQWFLFDNTTVLIVELFPKR